MLKQVIFGIFFSCVSVSCYRVIQVLSSPTIGVSATTFWDCRSKSLYYADFFSTGVTSMLFRYDYVNKRHYSANILGSTGGVSNLIPLNCAPNQFLVLIGPCAIVIYWDGFSGIAIKLRDVYCVEPVSTNQIISYAKVDPKRRVYTGTVHITYCAKMPPESSIYRYDKMQGVVKSVAGIGASGGMDWNIRTKQFYHKDVCQNTIMEYQWSLLTGELTNGHPIFQFTDPSSVGNGMTIDKFGMLYVTMYNGSSVVKIDPRTSSIVETYVLPARFPSSITFCGPLLDALCVSTGSIEVDVRTGTIANTPITPSDGKLFIIKDIFTRGYCDRKPCV